MKTYIIFYYCYFSAKSGRTRIKKLYSTYNNILTTTNLMTKESSITFNDVSVPDIADKISYERYEAYLIEHNCI